MIATGNHNFEKFAALCNTLSGAPLAKPEPATIQRTAQFSNPAGGFYPPLQGVSIHPGACKNPGLRAHSIRPYRAYAFIRVLANIRDYGRLSAPTVQVGKPVSFTQPLCPISWQGKRFGVQYVTGRVREPTYWYAVRSVSKKARWTQMGTGVQRAFYVYDYSAEIR